MSVLSGNRSAVLLDQYPLWLDAVENVLERLGIDVVGKATSPSRALALIEERQPDLFVTEIGVAPGEVDGITCLREARERVPKLRAVVLSSYEDREHIEQSLAAGAVAYVVKTAHPDDLASAVRQAFSHSIFLAPSGHEQPPVPMRQADDVAGLTRRELEILRLVAEGMSNAELARKLWVTEQTVKFHLSNVYRKLGVANRTEASRWAQLHGLLPATALDVSTA
jgi:DNA-binding NarL/FixJ family response regulator